MEHRRAQFRLDLVIVWNQTGVFTKWLYRFVHFVKPSTDDPVLLTVGGHYSHIKNVYVMGKVREHSVTNVSLPPHFKHKMQPLDVGFMKPQKTYYAQETETWLGSNPGRVVTSFVACKLFGPAYRGAEAIEASVNSFIKTGLFLCNRHIFQGNEFACYGMANLKINVLMELAITFQDREHQIFLPTTPVVGNL
jgi:hypothetical protein